MAKICPDYKEGESSDACLFIDYWGKRVKSLTVNGSFIEQDRDDIFFNHKIYIPSDKQKVGPNTVIIEFESSYVTTCEGF